MADYRVRVTRVRNAADEPPWLALLVNPTGFDSIPVGRFASHREAVTRGCTALRFVAAGIPWRAAS